MATPFNPLECEDRLAAANIPPSHAKAFAKEYSHMAHSLIDQLVTKADLKASEDRIDARFEIWGVKFDAKLDRLESKFENLETKFESLETKFESLETKSEAQFNRLIDRIESNEKQADERFKTIAAQLKLSLGGMIFTGFTATAGLGATLLRFLL